MKRALVLIGVGLWLEFVVVAVAWLDRLATKRRGPQTTVPKWARLLGERDGIEAFEARGEQATRVMRVAGWVLVALGVVGLIASVF
jgi:hypothetical protein